MAYFLLDTGEKVTYQGSIEFSLESPLFSDMNTYSVSGKAPKTEANSLALDRPELIDAADNQQRIIDCYFVSNLVTLKGKLKVTTPEDTYYKITFVGQSAFWYEMGDNTLRENDFGTIEVPEDLRMKQRTTLDDFIFTNNNTPAYALIPTIVYGFYTNHPVLSELEGTNRAGDNDINRFHLTRYDSISDNPIAPSFFAKYILELVCSSLGFDITENALSKAMFDNLLVFSNHVITGLGYIEGTAEIEVTEIEVVDETTLRLYGENIHICHYVVLLSDFNCTNNTLLNNRTFLVVDDGTENQLDIEIDTSGLISEEDISGAAKWLVPTNTLNTDIKINKHLPNYTFKEFCSELNKCFGLVTIPSETKKEVRFKLMKDILLNESSTDITGYAGTLYNKTLATKYDGYKLSFSKAQNDAWFEERITELNDYNTYKGEVNAIGDLPMSNNSDGDYYYVKNEAAYYNWESNKLKTDVISGNEYTGEWDYFSTWIPFNESDTDEPYEIETSCVPIPVSYTEKYATRIDCPFNFDFVQELTDIGIRIMFLVNNNGSPAGCYFNDSLSLRWKGEKGIYNQLRKEEINWRLNRYREAKSYIQWPQHLLRDFQWDKKYQVNGTNYLIERIPVKIAQDDTVTFGATELVRV